ncbi:MAG TPA: undecaprenyl-diphosphate phosphatase [Candidatus Paceibacterota bacterium]|nr:undecaprenyl-diphosphate phosphatase [Candidatus Paceibacterota bacterium]
MLTLTQGIVLGIVQGITELFPVSSLGHSTLIPALLHWQINEQDPAFLEFLVATHFATALVLFLYYWKDWMRILRGIVRSLITRSLASDSTARLGWLLIVGTVPAGVLGFVFQNKIEAIFINPRSAALFLAANGVLIFGAEWLRNSTYAFSGGDNRIARLSWGKGFFVGIMQSLALIPGFSRTGSSLSGGLIVGLSHEDALRFAFLLSTPIIGAAALLKLPELFKNGDHALLLTAFVGSLCAALFSYLSVRFLTSYFKIESRSLAPFALYCLIVGITAFFLVS